MSDTNPELQAMSLPELLAQTVDCRNGHHSWTERGHGPCSACGEPSPPPVMPQLECGCLQGACHGGHTIDVGPPWVCIPEERLRQFRDDEYVCVTDDVRSMAAELLALRARVSSWSDRLQELTAHGAELDRRGRELEAAHREPTSHAYVVQWKRYPGGNNEGLDDIVELYADWGEAMDKVRALRDRGYSPGFARNGVHEPRPVTE